MSWRDRADVLRGNWRAGPVTKGVSVVPMSVWSGVVVVSVSHCRTR